MKLGLRRGTVELRDHDNGWDTVFAKEKRLLEKALGDLCVAVEHVGSSAVEDLKTKPILDIAVAINSTLNVEEAVTRIKSTEYLFRGDRGDAGGYLFVRGDADSRYIHMHLLAISDPQWRRYLRFRDILRKNTPKRQEYEQLKVSLAARFPRDRERYTVGKVQFIEQTLSAYRD